MSERRSRKEKKNTYVRTVLIFTVYETAHPFSLHMCVVIAPTCTIRALKCQRQKHLLAHCISVCICVHTHITVLCMLQRKSLLILSSHPHALSNFQVKVLGFVTLLPHFSEKVFWWAISEDLPSYAFDKVTQKFHTSYPIIYPSFSSLLLSRKEFWGKSSAKILLYWSSCYTLALKILQKFAWCNFRKSTSFTFWNRVESGNIDDAN